MERIFFEKKDVSKVHSASEHGLRQTPHHMQRTAQAPASRSSNFYGHEEASSGKTCNGNMHKKRRRPATTTTKKKKKKKKGLFPAFFRSQSFPFCGSPQERRLVPRANGEYGLHYKKSPHRQIHRLVAPHATPSVGVGFTVIQNKPAKSHKKQRRMKSRMPSKKGNALKRDSIRSKVLGRGGPGEKPFFRKVSPPVFPQKPRKAA